MLISIFENFSAGPMPYHKALREPLNRVAKQTAWSADTQNPPPYI